MTTSQPAEPVGAVEGLLRAAGGLTANQLAILSGVADALSRPVEITRPTGSDLVDDTFAETMANLLTLHHALHEEPLSKRPFEYVFKQCLRAQGIGAELNSQPGDSSYDIDADGVRWSLKTEAAKGISPSQVKVEKFMEARWIRECTTPEACATAVPKIISHMDGYDRIIVLRAFERSPYVHYRLEEIPKALLERCLAGATASMFEKRGKALSYGADFRLAHGRPELVEFAARARSGYRDWESRAGTVLVDQVGTLVTGAEAHRWAQAMTAAGARVEAAGSDTAAPDLPVRHLPTPAIADPEGGVIDAHATGEFLVRSVGTSLVRDRVHALELTGTGMRVRGGTGWRRHDAGVVVAGAATAPLAAQVGVDVPDVRAHHARFAFALDDPDTRSPCLLEHSGSWRAGVTFYQHLAAPGQRAVGVDLPHDLRAWRRGRAAVVETSRQITIEYVRECLRGVGGEPVDELYCDAAEGWGDGFVVQRAGAVLVLHGGNLFKLAPALGETLAGAVCSGDTPASMHDPQR